MTDVLKPDAVLSRANTVLQEIHAAYVMAVMVESLAEVGDIPSARAKVEEGLALTPDEARFLAAYVNAVPGAITRILSAVERLGGELIEEGVVSYQDFMDRVSPAINQRMSEVTDVAEAE